MPGKKIRHTKRATIARVEREYWALDRIVRRLGPRLAEDVPGFGARARIKRERWTGKDTLAHIVAWKHHQLRTLRRERHDMTIRGKPFAEQNRILYSRWHRRSLRDVVAYHRSIHRDLVAALRTLPDSYFKEPPRSPQWPNDLVGHAADHRERHLEALLNVDARRTS